jgi:PKD repeat protein
VTYFVPEKIQAARAITINGVVYTKGQVLTAAQAKAIPHLSSLLSSGRLTAVPDVSRRRAVKGNRTPTNIPPKALAEMYADLGAGEDETTAAVVLGRIVTVTIVGGQPDWTINWGDGVTEVHSNPVIHHAYAANAAAQTYTITVTGGEKEVYPTFTAVIPAAPVAAFTSAVGALTLSKTATFTNTSTGVANFHSWDFGDGSALDTTASPVHVYATAGTWHVTLTETNAQGVGVITHDVVTT